MKIARFFCVSCFTASVRLEGLLGANAASEQSPAIPTFCTSTFFFWLGGIVFAEFETFFFANGSTPFISPKIIDLKKVYNSCKGVTTAPISIQLRSFQPIQPL